MSIPVQKPHLLIQALLCCAMTTGCAMLPHPSAVHSTVQTVSHEDGVPGGVMKQLTLLEATVEKIDYHTREVILRDDEDQRKTLRIHDNVPHLEQVKPGDKIRVSYSEELVVYAKERGAPLPQGTSQVNNKAVSTRTQEQTAIVKALDLEHHTATLRFPDGGERTFLVREDVTLDKGQIGREIVFRHSEALGISIESR